MTIRAGYATPMLHVASIERSIEFYSRLGFDTVDTDRCEPLGWARIHCEGGALMFLRSEPHEHDSHGHHDDGQHAHEHEHGLKHPHDHDHDHVHPALMLVMYSSDLPGLRAQLAGHGMTVPEISYPEYMPSGALSLTDPDGNIVLINHWGETEHKAWLERIGRAVE
jgi:catechol 2,3-dioxygenase-like lactoylglutathione lyase family enzyme